MEEKPVTIRRLLLAAARGSPLDEKRAGALFQQILARQRAQDKKTEDFSGGDREHE